MTAKPFEFSDEAYDKARELMSELLTQAYNKDYPVAPTDDLLDLLRPYVQAEIDKADEAGYDRGKENGLSDGYDDGYHDGYNQGYSTAEDYSD